MNKDSVNFTTTYSSDVGLKKAIITESWDSGSKKEATSLSVRLMISNHVECVVSPPTIYSAVDIAGAWCDRGELPKDV